MFFQGCNSCNFEVPFANVIYMDFFPDMLWYSHRIISKDLDWFVYVRCALFWFACPKVWVWVYITVQFGYLLNVVLLRICDYYICMKCLCTIWKYKWMHCYKAVLYFSASLKNIKLYWFRYRNSVKIKWSLLFVFPSVFLFSYFKLSCSIKTLHDSKLHTVRLLNIAEINEIRIDY